MRRKFVSLRRVIENNIAISLFTVAVAAFSAGWISYGAVQHASKLEAVPEYSLRELEKRASLGKEDLNEEIEVLRNHIENLNEHISLLRIVILKNRSDEVLKISNVRLSPQTPSKVKVGDTITAIFQYKISDGAKLDLHLGPGTYGKNIETSMLLGVTGEGEAKLRFTPLSPGQINQIVISRTSTPTELDEMAKWAPELLIKDGHKMPARAKFGNTLWVSYQMYVDYKVARVGAISPRRAD